MATIFKRGKTYYARFMHQGKDVCKSTGKTTKDEAEKELKRILNLYKERGSLEDTFDQLLEGISQIDDKKEQSKRQQEFARRLLQGMLAKLEISKSIDAWLRIPRTTKESTIAGYCSIWKRFYAWLQTQQADLEYLNEITPAMASEYARDVWGGGFSPATYKAHIKFLRSMFNALSDDAGIEFNPWQKINLSEVESETEGKRELKPKELTKACSKAEGDMRIWFAIGLYTGLRLGDVICLQWKNLDLKNDIIEVMPLKTSRKRKTVRFSIHPVLKVMLLEHRDSCEKGQEYLFPDAVRAYKKDTGAITRLIQAHFEDCDIQTKEKPTNGRRKKAIVRVGFHSLRHSFVSLCAANRVPEVAIMEMVGHGSPAMTRLYSHAGDEQKMKAIAALPAIDFK